VLGLGALAMSACAPAGPGPAFEARVAELHDELIAVRRDLHRNPEVSGSEERTARIVSARLEALGLEVRTGVGGHGVVGLLQGGLPGPVVAFRADMDAVRSNAPDQVPFASEVPGVRHICGHDVHTTVGLALAEGFPAVRDELPGSILFVFQPAEENATGARAMLADGVFDDLTPDAIFAFHSAPLPVGQVATAEVTLMPGRDRIQVTVAGDGDVAEVAADVRRVIEGVGTITAEQATAPVEGRFAFVNLGASVVPPGGGSATVRGIITVSGESMRTQVKLQLSAQLAVLEVEDVTVRLDYEDKLIAGVTNDPDLVGKASASARRILGDDGVVLLNTLIPMFSEDFGSFQDQVPGVMFFLGVANPAVGINGLPHSPDFAADEEAIGVGATVMGAVLLDYLSGS
jgi:amidohydrolase